MKRTEKRGVPAAAHGGCAAISYWRGNMRENINISMAARSIGVGEGNENRHQRQLMACNNGVKWRK